MIRLRKRIALAALLLSALLSDATFAATVPVNFQGPEQVLNVQIDASGELTAEGQGSVFDAKAKAVTYFTTVPPITQPVSLTGGPLSLISELASVAPVESTLNIVNGDLVGIENLHIQGLQDATLPVVFDTLFINTNSTVALLKSISIDISFEAADLSFTQLGPAIMHPFGDGTGLFELSGTLAFTYRNVTALVAGLLPISLGDLAASSPLSLIGGYAVSGPANNTKVVLDAPGTLGFALDIRDPGGTGPYLFGFEASAPLALTLSASVRALLEGSIDGKFHLEQSGLIVPEPSSIGLLGLGLLALAACSMCRRNPRPNRRSTFNH